MALDAFKTNGTSPPAEQDTACLPTNRHCTAGAKIVANVSRAAGSEGVA